MRLRILAQLLAYTLVISMAIFSVAKVQSYNKDRLNDQRTSLIEACELNNGRTALINRQFADIYKLIGSIGTRIPAGEIKKQLQDARQHYKPLKPTPCQKIYIRAAK